MKKLSVLLVVIMMFSASEIFASGLAIPEQGAAAMGMSAAMTARSEDLSAIFYNPAGIDYVEKFEIMLGITPIMPTHEYSPFNYSPYTEYSFRKKKSEPQTFLPPQLYAAYRASNSIVLGLGVNAPFGLGTEWDKEWDGRYSSTIAEIQAVHITPTITYQATEKVSVGLGVSYVTSTATIEKMVDTGSKLFEAMGSNPALSTLVANTDYDSEFALEGDGTGFGYNLGVIYRMDEKFQFGISYRGAMDLDYEGTAKFKHKEQAIKTAVTGAAMAGGADAVTAAATADAAYAKIAGSMPATQDGTATLALPWMLNLGLKADITNVWDISAELDIVGWSVYDELTIDFEDDKPYDKLTQDKNWVKSYVYRLGTSYDISDSFIARGGLMFDFNPVPELTFDGQLPDSDRFGISIGAGYKIGVIQFDASYLLLKFLTREKDNGVGFGIDSTGNGIVDRFDVPLGYPVANGKYRSFAHLLSVSASYKF